MSDISRFLEIKYRQFGEDGQRIIQHVEGLWAEFEASAHPSVSGHVQQELCSGDCCKFLQRYWELLLARHLRACGFAPEAKPDAPDFRIARDQLTIWVEAVAPSAGSEEILVPSGDEIVIPSNDGHRRVQPVQTDHKAILRRWTSALRSKHQGLIGVETPQGWKRGYLDKGIVSPNDAYVIAINSCLLPGLDALHGPSGLPWAVEALFGAGARHITFDRQTLEYVSDHHTFRPSVLSKEGSPIPTAIFLDDQYAHLSAVLATYARPDTVGLHGAPHIIVAHNPVAQNKVAPGVFGASVEYIVDDFQEAYVKIRIWNSKR